MNNPPKNDLDQIYLLLEKLVPALEVLIEELHELRLEMRLR